jgi:tetratricopeptide (TPR) repeat protein
MSRRMLRTRLPIPSFCVLLRPASRSKGSSVQSGSHWKRAGLGLLVGVTIAAWLNLAEVPASAQGAKGKAAKKPEKPEKPQEPEQLELRSLAFDFVVGSDEYTPDPDETPEGQARLVVITNRAKELYREYDVIERERRPLAGQRDIIGGEMYQLGTRLNQVSAAIRQTNTNIAELQSQISVSNNNDLKNQLRAEQQSLGALQAEGQGCSNAINARRPKFDALCIAIKPLDNRLQKMWAELNDCRKQWLEIRVPNEKYARSDFELLKSVLNDWLIVDGLWPDAFCWGALCSYELGDFDRADELIEKADKIRTNVLGSRKTWSQIEALQGLVYYRLPRQQRKSVSSLEKAMSHVDKEDWVTPFIAGRAAAEPDRKKAAKAKAYFERALKTKPNCIYASFHLAVLQTTTDEKAVRDVPAGLKVLESLWTRTGKRSWRMSVALAKAYDAANRKGDANRQWETALALAPERNRANLRTSSSQ